MGVVVSGQMLASMLGIGGTVVFLLANAYQTSLERVGAMSIRNGVDHNATAAM